MTAINGTVGDGDVLRDIADVCSVPLTAIEDLYPCTPLQVGIMAQPIERIYVNCVWATLPPSVDADGFCRALCQIYAMNPVLRTRIVDCEFGLVQVVLKEALSISYPSQSLEEVLEHEKSAPMRLGTPLFRAALLGRKIILTTHHAIADGGTYHRMFDNLSRIYHGQSLPPHANFKLFVKHCLSIDESTAKAFWGPRFTGHPTVFPKIDVEYIPDASKKLETQIHFGPWGLSVPLGLLSSYIETAWAMTVISYTNAESVVFGRVLSARVPGLGGLETTLGPTIVTMPVQVNLSKDSTIAALIKERAQERREALKSPALQYGLIRIRDVNGAAKIASRFTTILNFRTPTDDGRDYESSDLMEIHGEYEAHLPYGLGISIILSGKGLSIETLFDENVVCERQTRRILRQFEHILTLLLQSPAGTRLDKLQLLNTHDRRELLGWNMIDPESAPQQSLHNLFRGIVHTQPKAQAAEGPDGHLTYEQLDQMTDSLACELGRRGIGAEDAIALVFEKSTWMVVAQLSVLKAGAVCVPIDPDFPFARKETIISGSGAKMILTSIYHQGSLKGHKPGVMAIDAQSVSQLLPVEKGRQPGVEDTPSQAAFILFTSGSTGTPKGHILEHRNLASSLTAIGREMKWEPGVRMLQFAAYVWDMSIAEIFGTLISGGCVCIPSEEARESFIEDFIQSQRVDCAIFTPTVLRMISPQDASSLKTIMSIGEPVDLESVDMWSGHARFFNAWGPSETACVSSMAELSSNSPYRESIGRPLASAIWLIDEKNVNNLVPVGGVGEIVVESMGVARGYLNDQRQTAASFISPPRWAPPRKGHVQRMYRTGDLARYNPDGSLEYIGRLDNQVKIHGQRVELGEVERALSACAAVRHAIAAIQPSKEGNGRKDLIAVLTLEEPRLPTRTALKELSPNFFVERSLESIREALASRLPSYMVPTIWKVVEDFPRTASWKIDRNSIKKWLTQWAPERTRDAVTDTLTPPASPTERCLQATWALALGIPEGEIGRESSFIKLGGDSILAIKVATQCRKRGVRVSVATLLRSENLANVASASELLPNYSQALTKETLTNGAKSLSAIALSPFQQLLLRDGIEAVPKASTFRYHFQDRKGHNVTVDAIGNALLKLVNHHPMLRARFVQRGGRWAQTIVPVSEVHHPCVRVYPSEMPEGGEIPTTAKPKPSASAHEFLLSAELISPRECQSYQPILLLTSYSLIDKSSWRIICRDLEALLVDPNLELPPTPSFSEWIQTQVGLVSDTTRAPELKRTPNEYWALALHKPVTYDNALVEHEVSIDTGVTEAIFGPCNRPFNTKPVELLLAAVLLLFEESFPDRAGPALYAQHDGRETSNTLLDFSGTVGNFTTLVPILPGVGTGSSVGDAVIAVKDGYRSALRDESAAFASCMLSHNPLNESNVEILFSFEDLEEQRNTERSKDSTHIKHLGLLIIHAQRLDKQLGFWISYDGRIAHQERLRSWTTRLGPTLGDLAAQLAYCAPRLTMSEAPLLDLDTGDLKEIQTRLDSIGISTTNVEALLPCSPIQEGILLSQLKNPHNQYWMRLTMKLTPTSDTDEVDVERVKMAWEAVCSAQPILRTVFVGYETKTSAFQQVILRSTSPSVILHAITGPDQARIESVLNALEAPPVAAAQPPHHLQLIRVSPAIVYATLDINHALFDERSMQLVGEQLGQAYTNATSLRKGLNLAGYLTWIAQHKEAARDYWKAHLSGVKPCLMPVLEPAESQLLQRGSSLCDIQIEDAHRLGSFCRSQGVTVANLMQVAWSMVLRLCTGSKSLCFGYLHSNVGSLEGAEGILGPLLSMAFHRFEAASNTTLTEILKKSNDDSSRGLDHGACSLSEVLEALDATQSSLFNTIMTIFRLWPRDLANTSDIRVEHMPLQGHTEYAITLGIAYDNDSIVSKLLYDPSKISRSFATQIARLFAAVVTKIVCNPGQSIETLEASVEKPTSVFSAQDIAKAVYRKAASQCEIASSIIEDIHPCTSLQRQQIEAAVRENSGGGLDQYVFRVGDQMSVATIHEAWELVAAACPALRTRMVSLGQYGVCQVTLKTFPDCAEEDSLSEYLHWDKDFSIRYGGPLCRFGKIEEPGGTIYLVLSLHPIIYDPWTLGLVLEAFGEALNGEPLTRLISLGTFMRRLPNRNTNSAQGVPKAPIASHLDAAQFPALQQETPNANLSGSKSLDLNMPLGADVLRSAWTLCLSRVTGDDKVFFGVHVEGRNAPDEIAQVAGPVGVVVPLTMDLATTPTGESLVRATREFTDGYIPQTQNRHGLSTMSRGKDASCSFRNLLIVDSGPAVLQHLGTLGLELIQTNVAASSFWDVRLVVLCRVTPHGATIEMKFDEQVISLEQGGILLEQYRHAIDQLSSPDPTPIADLPPLSKHELALLQAWNKDMPIAEVVCIHDQIRRAAKTKPAAPAICSWDFDLNHTELDDFSDRIATFLQRGGIGAGTIVPYFLEKSAAAIVVMLGILKAGGTLLPVDIKHPAQRIETILSETSAPRIVTSTTLSDTVRGRLNTQDAVVVDMELIRNLPPGGPGPVDVKPSDICYIIYTSGSTGKPKGTMITHSNFSTSIKYRRELLNMSSDTRTLQYLNFIFDVSMFDVFLTLLSGGCVCLPSEEEWSNDMAGAIQRTRANFAFLTPSLATLLNPGEVPTLRTLGLTGEPCEKHVIEKWKHIRVLNMYGPAEATVHSSGCDVSFNSGKHHLNIGRSGGCLYWVANPTDYNRLVPIGCPGELLIQGPIVSLGYLGDPDKTAAAFIDPPSWMRSFEFLGHSQRWYKTGDIVVQAPDGSMIYHGRKDTQVKLSGQRIELGEIEHCLNRSSKTRCNFAVELIKPSGQDRDPCLAVFFAVGPPKRSKTAGAPCELLPPLAGETSRMRLALAAALPAYMVPQFFVHLNSLPFTSSGKTDRASLRKIGATLSPRQLSSYDPRQRTLNGSIETVPPSTAPKTDGKQEDKLITGLEAELQQLWSETLDLPLDSIKSTDNFFNIGGSSIRAMRLSHAARRAGISLKATDVFQAPILSEMATIASRHGAAVINGGPDSSRELTTKLVNTSAFMSSCFAHAAKRHEPYLVRDNIESIALATDVQADMVAVGELDGEAWHNEMIIESPTGLDVSDVTRACKAVISHHRMFRTVFVQHGNALYQIAVKEVPLESMVTVGGAAPDTVNPHANLDTYLPHFHLDEVSNEGTRCHKIHLRIHHALYDAISMDMVLRDLRQVYSRQTLSNGPSFYDWVSHVSSVDMSASRAFWKHGLEGSSMTYLVTPSVPVTPYFCRDSMQFRVPLRNVITSYGTPSSVVQAAWALVLSRATGRDDVVFCAPNASRSLSSFHDIDRVCGLCLNFLPARARLQNQMTLSALIRQMQTQAVAAIPHQHQGFRSIIENCTDWPSWTRYGSMLIYQNHESLEKTIRFGDEDCVLTPRGKFGRCADILIEATPSPSPGKGAEGKGEEMDLVIDMLYSRRTFTEEQVNWISRNFAKILETVPQSLEQPIGQDGAQAGSPYMTSLASIEPNRASTAAADIGNHAQTLVHRAWTEVGISVGSASQTRQGDCSMFGYGADLVTTMLLARYYQYNGYQVAMEDLINNPTRASQAKLIGYSESREESH